MTCNVLIIFKFRPCGKVHLVYANQAVNVTVCVCVWNIWRDVKLLLLLRFHYIYIYIYYFLHLIYSFSSQAQVSFSLGRLVRFRFFFSKQGDQGRLAWPDPTKLQPLVRIWLRDASVTYLLLTSWTVDFWSCSWLYGFRNLIFCRCRQEGTVFELHQNLAARMLR